MKLLAIVTLAIFQLAIGSPATLDVRSNAATLRGGSGAASVQAAQTVTGTITASALKCRTCASTSCTAVRQYSKGTKITIKCAKHGEVVNGYDWWDYTKENCYVSEYYVDLDAIPADC